MKPSFHGVGVGTRVRHAAWSRWTTAHGQKQVYIGKAQLSAAET